MPRSEKIVGAFIGALGLALFVASLCLLYIEAAR